MMAEDNLMDYRGRGRFIGNMVHRCVGCGSLSEEKLAICCRDSHVKEDYQLSGFGQVTSYTGDFDGIFNFPNVTIKSEEGIVDRDGVWVGIEEPQAGKPAEFRVRLTKFDKRPSYNTPNRAYSEALTKNVPFKVEYKGDLVGIRGWGTWIGEYSIPTKEIAPSDFIEKRIAHPTEDAFTMASEAAMYARRRAGCALKGSGTILLGTEHKPTHSQPYSNLIGTRVNAPPTFDTGDMSAACIAGQNTLVNCLCQVEARQSDWAISAWSDYASFLGRADEDLRRFTGDGAIALEIGRGNKENLVAVPIRNNDGKFTSKYATFTPDYDVDSHARAFHGKRFTGKPGYEHHTREAAKTFFKEFDLKPADFTYFVGHNPNLGFVLKLGKELGFNDSQMAPNRTVSPCLGNMYSASPEVCWALEHSKPEDRILIQKYGSGAQSLVTPFQVLGGVEERKDAAPTVEELIAHKKMIKLAEHEELMRMREKILGLS
jgi:hydroxymethylglutaryl-CoA synthase